MRFKIWAVMMLILAVAVTAAPTITLQPNSIANNQELNATLSSNNVLNLTVSPSSRIIYVVNGGSYTELSANTTAVSTSPGAISLVEGSNTIRVVAIESNVSNASLDISVLKDTVLPDVQVQFSPAQTQPGQNNVILSWDFEDNNLGEFWISLVAPNGTVIFNETSDEHDNYALPSNTLKLGVYNASYVVNDTVGNSVRGSKILTVSDSKPVVTLGGPDNATLTNHRYVEVSCSATDENLTKLAVYHNNDQSWQEDDEKLANSSQTIRFNLTSLDTQTFLWNCMATDASGSTSFAQENKTIIIDALEPSVKSLSPIDGYGTLQKEVTFQWVVQDNRNNSISCSLWVDNSRKKQQTFSDGDEANYKIEFEHGEHNWTVDCEDQAGNVMNTSVRKFNVDLGLAKPEEKPAEPEPVKETPKEEVKAPEPVDESETKVVVKTQDVKTAAEQEEKKESAWARFAKAIGGRFTFRKSVTIAAFVIAATLLVLIVLGVREYSKDNIMFRVKVRKYKFKAKTFYEKYILRKKNYF